ncbi:hypothetical protein KY495_18640 [Massilia sp. PAMC28688]|uniref:hypothetical protein n=1 Tax=Massilia sp. PAMC28688 TaxID=2861283 RepID=UPI001C625359|nr:hypothetical protein [Massilia sp. PAMC28688]QYF92730.1 hypothetical protein KY495_18640 [Massilia sp. PAMC28688]
MTTPKQGSPARLDREVEREREERHKNDEARSGLSLDDDFRVKDARDSASSGQLNRQRSR